MWILLAAGILLVLYFLFAGLLFNQAVAGRPLPLPHFVTAAFRSGDDSDPYFDKVRAAEKEVFALGLSELSILSYDGLKLRSYYYKNPQQTGKLVILSHGMRSSGTGEFAFLHRYYVARGFDLLFVDHRACGRSEGKYLGYGYLESRDLISWAQFANQLYENRVRIYMHGVSMGAAAVLLASADKSLLANVQSVVSDCAYTSMRAELAWQVKKVVHLHAPLLLKFVDLWCGMCAHYRFKNASPLDAVRQARVPVLFVHGDADDYVPFAMQEELYIACTAKKSKTVIHGASHARSYFTDTPAYETALDVFFSDTEQPAIPLV